ncbi:hypothetical protein LTR86_004541 [Recurvomyces mirabilis]|nr:hypothetical protein LTR86_004541 [Recurvomyces mirabilis]
MTTSFRLTTKKEDNPFVMVLIDGDNTNFLDHYLAEGAEGGRQAAIDLYDLLVEYVAGQNESNGHWPIAVRVYANMQGLAETYRRSGIVGDPTMFRAFVKAFNGERRLFEFIDAGDDKEAADRKIEGTVLVYGLTLCT